MTSAVGLGLAGWYIAGVSDAALVPATAVAALAGAIALAVVGARRHILSSPLLLLGLPLLLSLAAAMLPITRIFGAWTLDTLALAVAIVAAPIAGVATGMLSRAGAPRACSPAPLPDRTRSA